ncbi:MAG: alpha-D-ribose 1-methylphosphonate 5-triphosphate diphosphatase [Rhodobacteraceae bacterium]|nr:alpha-D-ribose 1-methylphosphonate 5-triphosphate diphosphatase [Paracoccaceae bacterium]
MIPLALDLVGAEMLHPKGGLYRDRLSLADGRIVDAPVGRRVDLSGYLILPGIIDLHGDGFERHLAPRRGVMKDMSEGVVAAEAEMAANGITTAVMAQFISWEGGLRGADYAADVFAAIRRVRGELATDLIAQLRFETHLLDQYADLPERIADWQVPYVVFNDHLPHDRLAEGRRPPRLIGQALKAGRNPEVHLEMLNDLHARSHEVPAALDDLCRVLAQQGIQMGSHDDQTGAQRQAWRARGVRIAEFPETPEAAAEARAGGDAIVFGAPNVVRGSSHKGNVSAVGMVAKGLCDALSSDYHYPSPRRAALTLARDGVVDMGLAWGLVSSGPARVLGLDDRGTLEVGKRADLVVLDCATNRVAVTVAGGRISYLNGDVAGRFMTG